MLKSKPGSSELFQIGEHYNLVINVFGRRGSGKTYLCAFIAQEFKRVIIFDTRNRFGSKDADIKGAQIFTNLEDFGEAIERLPAEYKIIYKPLDPHSEFEDFCAYCDTKEVNGCLVLIEEIGELTHSNHSGGLPFDFSRLLRFGRHHGIFLLLNSQRPVDVHRTITAESSHIICFNQFEPRDIQYFSGYFGKDVERLRTLGKHEFLVWKNGEITVYDKKQKRKSEKKIESVPNETV